MLTIKILTDYSKQIALYWDAALWKKVAKSLFLKEVRALEAVTARNELEEKWALIEERVAKRYALFLLGRRALLTTELKAKLQEKGIGLQVAEGIASSFQAKGFLDDEALLQRRSLAHLQKGRSYRELLAKMKGGHLDIEQSEFDAKALEKWIFKHQRSLRNLSSQEKNRCIQRLLRKGFSWELIQEKVSAHWDE